MYQRRIVKTAYVKFYQNEPHESFSSSSSSSSPFCPSFLFLFFFFLIVDLCNKLQISFQRGMNRIAVRVENLFAES